MANRTYWIDIFTETTWREFREHGCSVSGFPERRWKTVQKIRVGDYFLSYMTGIKRFFGVFKVVRPPYRDATVQIWKEDLYPCRVGVEQVELLTLETAAPIDDIKGLSLCGPGKKPTAWIAYVRAALRELNDSDGEIILQAILDAKENPVHRPTDARKPKRRPAVASQGSSSSRKQ